MIRKPVKDGLGNNVRDYIWNPAENTFQHKDELVHESSYDMKPKILKVGSPEHKQKFPDRYKSGYVDWWNRDKKEKVNKEPLVKQFRNDDPSTYLSSPEQQKGMLLATIEDAKKHKLKPRKITHINFKTITIIDNTSHKGDVVSIQKIVNRALINS